MSQKTVVQWLDFVPNGWRSMEQFLLGLDEAMRARGWQSVYVFAGEPSVLIKDRLQALGSPYLVSANPLTRAGAVALGRTLHAWRPALIQTHFLSKFDPALRHVKRHSGARRLVVADHSSGEASRKPWPLQAMAWLRGRWAARHVDLIVGVSDFVCRRDVEDVFFPAGQVVRVHNGVDTQRFAPPAQPPDNPVFTVAFVGQLIRQKGVDTLVAAIKVLHDEGVPVRLVIAGQGPHGDALHEQVRRVGLVDQVNFLGQIDWAARLYGEADVVVAPSEWAEAFGFVVAEAAAA
ncbi:glycosyltransferase, partial [Aquabacterium sp.]|uniref:glycosyltransferase n=1 Tax=Aquabacterium sp. TaxID=1872578 RepID=UPI0025B86B78